MEVLCIDIFVNMDLDVKLVIVFEIVMLKQLVDGLNVFGIGLWDMILIFQVIKVFGVFQVEIEVF